MLFTVDSLNISLYTVTVYAERHLCDIHGIELTMKILGEVKPFFPFSLRYASYVFIQLETEFFNFKSKTRECKEVIFLLHSVFWV